MIEALFSQPQYVATKRMLDATALRQEALASNIANLETPGYKRLDVNPSFKDELTRALNTPGGADISHLRPTLSVDESAVSSTRDGNTVDLEKELLEMNQNTISHTLETQLVTSKLVQLRMAITGR